MWKPPEKIRYSPEPGAWPTRDQAENSLWFSPIRIGPLTLASRTWVPAMVPWRSNEEGWVTDDVLDWYEQFARGCPGGLVVEATGIRDIPSGPLLRISHDRYIPGLKELAQTVRTASNEQTRLFIQCIDFLVVRRRPDPGRFMNSFLVVTDAIREALDMEDADETAIREILKAMPDDELDGIIDSRQLESLRMGFRERVSDMQAPHIRDLPTALPGMFAAAARRAQEAGIDGIELHYAHAYTMASFLSRTNNRDDGYGGTPSNRVRLPLEVFGKVREAVGDDYAVGCRFLTEDIVAGGSTVEDSIYYATEFARAGMDFLSLSRGGRFEDARQPNIGEAVYPYTGRSGYECMPAYISDEQGPFGRNIGPGKAIRDAVRGAGFETPVIVTGGIHGFEKAEQILQEGKADLVGLARQALADPEFFTKVRSGCGSEVRVCEYTNYCEGLDQKHKQVTCKLWDREGIEDINVKRTLDGKRRTTAPVWSGVQAS
ncbi:MAG: NADH:flavin oxidoreductase [Rhodospirillaceae bacterium]|nr:NADH:flavin oxidoreductase [Rhodospirillaceae bacterium]